MFKIVTDIFCDLPKEYCYENDLTVVPASYTMGDKTYVVSLELDDHKAFYQALREGAVAVTTQVNTDQFIQAFTPILESGQDLIYIAFSSALSGTFNSGRMAVEELQQKYPDRKICAVDSLAASLGQGLLVFHAVKMQKQGHTYEEIVAWLEANKQKVNHWFTVEDLHFLRRGGRISGAAAIVGSILSIKPVLHCDENGRLKPVIKLKGRRKALQALVEQMETQGENIDGQQVFISHGDCMDDALQLKNMVLEKYPKCKVDINYVGPVIGSHSGPGTLALFFMGTKR